MAELLDTLRGWLTIILLFIVAVGGFVFKRVKMQEV